MTMRAECFHFVVLSRSFGTWANTVPGMFMQHMQYARIVSPRSEDRFAESLDLSLTV